MTDIKTGRVTAVDGLRGLLALVVVAWHVATPFGAVWLLIAAKAAVSLFFVLSGYALTRGWKPGFAAFAVRRLVRLWPVYAICLAAAYLIAGRTPVWSQFAWYPLLDPNDANAVNPPAWSLFFEVWTIPLMPLIVWARGSILRRAMPLALAFLAAAALVDPLLQIPVYFIAGACLADLDVRNRLLESAVPQWLGRISYSLYLSHAVIIAAAVRAFGPWGGVIALPATFAIGWLIWRTVEQPSIVLSRNAGRAVERMVADFRAPRLVTP